MKGIDGLDKVGQVRPLGQGTQNQVDGGADGDLFKKTFDRILSEKTDNTESQVTTVQGLGEISSFGLRIEDDSIGAIEKNTDSLLTLLDQYAKELGDPGKSLKDIEPLVQGIKEGADVLEASVQNATQADSALKSLAKESAVLANVEYMKFMRGDYV